MGIPEWFRKPVMGKEGSVTGKGAAVFTILILTILVDQLVNSTTFNSALATTIKPYIVPGMFVGVLVVALAMARGK